MDFGAVPKSCVIVLPPQYCSLEPEINKRSSGNLTGSSMMATELEETAAAILPTGEINLVKILKKTLNTSVGMPVLAWQHFTLIGSLCFTLA